ncbi:unnamed protein product [Cunninghamella echinulata]
MQGTSAYPSSLTEFDQLYARRHWSEELLNDDRVFLYSLSPLGNILYCSNSILITSYDTMEMIGRSITEFLHPDEHIPFFESLKSVFEVPHRMSKLQFRWKLKHAPGYTFLSSFGYSKVDNILPHYYISSNPSSNHIESTYSAFFAIAQPYDPSMYDILLKLKMENQILQQRIIQLSNDNNNNNNNINININNNNSNSNSNHHNFNLHNNNNNSKNQNQNQNTNTNTNNNNNNNNNNINPINNNTYTNNNHNNNDSNNINTPTSEISITSVISNPYSVDFDTNSFHSSSTTLHFGQPPPPPLPPPSSSSSSNINTSISTSEKFNNNTNILHTTPSSSSSWISSSNWQPLPASTTHSSSSSSSLHFSTTNRAASIEPTIKIENELKNENKQEDKKRKQKKIYVTSENYQCTDCGSKNSPEWRKGPLGPKTLCNACGLRWAKKNKKQTM